MKPKNWKRMATTSKRHIAGRLLNSERGHYIISQALVVAIKQLKKVPIPHREISNIQDMEMLLELFPIYAAVENVKTQQFADFKKEKEVGKKRCPHCGSTNLRTVAVANTSYDTGWEITCEECGELVDED